MTKVFYERLLSELADIENSVSFNDPDLYSEVESELYHIKQRTEEKLVCLGVENG